MADTIRDIIERLEKPLRLEAKQRYANRAVTNGIAAYVGEWARKGEHVGQTRDVREQFSAVRRRLARYDQADAAEREQMVAAALAALENIARPEAGPASATSGRTEARSPSAGSRAQAPQRAAAPPAAQRAAPRRPRADWRELDGPYEHTGKGKRPQWLDRLPNLGIETKRDLLLHFPRDYVAYKNIADVRDGERVCLRVTTVQRDVSIVRRTGKNLVRRYALEVADETGKAWITSFVSAPSGRRSTRWNPLTLPYEPGAKLFVEGTAKEWYGSVELQYLDGSTDTWAEDLAPGQLVPVYPLTDGVYQTQLRRAIRGLLDRYARDAPETLPDTLRRKHRLVGISDALANMHWPRDEAAAGRARKRLAFEEFLALQLALAQRKSERERPGLGMRLAPQGDLIARLEDKLPFRLTAAQRRVIQEIIHDMSSDRPMNRLLQGDVGSGKTVVAVAALLAAVDNGCQGALMAPTEILAEQHYLVLSKLLPSFGISVELLIGSVSKRDKEGIHERARAGETQVVVGTHALIQEGVEFKRLGVAVVDEQHRFGVVQRAALRGKGLNPELLVMTATPIPRTLALTVYGDLDVSALDEMPPGRKAVATQWLPSQRQDEAFAFAREQVAQARQAYVVCPLIEESEKLEAEAAVRLYEELRAQVFPDLRLGLLHGRMSTADKDAAMESFRGRETDILVSTTVIEVGVDVPNASLMLVLNAERFGLAQLHQLRGRVGRSTHQSHCVLVTDGRYNPHVRSSGDDPLQEGRRRMRVMVENNDGFVIAEEDLLLRGPGEFYGTRQHGLPDFRVARAGQDVALLEEARQAAFRLIEHDPDLSRPEHALLRERATEIRRRIESVAP
ncbi:MAG: ATP-dependent DNA helicase RecG [Armatimonadota bacterium]|nr:MAG: ATP-dependent DNA helicase RecG [Armatimonadota bacterium]